MTPASLVRALERSARRFGGNAARRKLALLRQAERLRLPSARALTRLHEALCWLRAYTDDAQVLARVRALLEGFASRADLRRHRDALADTGIAGTAIHYRYFAAQAQWLAQHWPQQLTLDRSDDGDDAQARIAAALPAVLTLAERHALAEMKLPGFAALDQLRGRGCTDAVFLLARIAAMPGDGFTREAFSDAIDAGYVLAPAAGTPPPRPPAFAPSPQPFVASVLLPHGMIVDRVEKLVDVIDIDQVYVQFYLDPKLMGTLREQEEVAVRFPVLGEEKFTGKISFIDPRIDAGSGLFRVKVLLDNRDRKIKAGMRGVADFARLGAK